MSNRSVFMKLTPAVIVTPVNSFSFSNFSLAILTALIILSIAVSIPVSTVDDTASLATPTVAVTTSEG